jgi:dihydroneopterin aldolase
MPGTLSIALEGISLKAPVGYYEYERANKNDFIIDIEVNIHPPENRDHDDIHNTLNYEKLHEAVVEEMMKPAKLMEDPAYRIMERIQNSYPAIISIKLDIRKKNPPMNADIRYSRVSLHWQKTQE